MTKIMPVQLFCGAGIFLKRQKILQGPFKRNLQGPKAKQALNNEI